MGLNIITISFRFERDNKRSFVVPQCTRKMVSKQDQMLSEVCHAMHFEILFKLYENTNQLLT